MSTRICVLVLGLLGTFALGLTALAPYDVPSRPIATASRIGACPDDLKLAVSDSTFENPEWVTDFLVNRGTPAWIIDFALQSFDSEDQDPVTGHYQDALNPPSRYIRFTRGGDADSAAFAMVGTWLAKTVVPLGGVSAIQIDFDNFGSNQDIRPLIVQGDRYFVGPKHRAARSLGWHSVQSGCLEAEDFAAPDDPQNQPDFSRPFLVGYSLEWGTVEGGHQLRDHLLDNFSVRVDGAFSLVDVTLRNRAPIAVNDRVTIRTEPGDRDIKPLRNDADPDGDTTLTIVDFSQGLYGSVVHPRPRTLLYELQGHLPVVDAPTHDSFGYTITDGEFESSASVTIIFDHACFYTRLAASKLVSVTSDLDLELIRRFRDEAMEPTEHGAHIVDHYYETTEILWLLIFDRPDLAVRAVSMVEMLQPALTDMLDGTGEMPIEQAQIDSIAAFFSDLSEAGSRDLKQLIDEELARIGPLDDYVGQPVSSVLKSVLGESVNTASGREAPDDASDRRLEQNYPNPFRGSTVIAYTSSEPGVVSVAIYDIRGQMIRALVRRQPGQGRFVQTWDGRNDHGTLVPSGTYIVRLVTEFGDESRAVSVLR